MRVVLDTDVVVAALRSPTGASAELLRQARHGRIRLAASVSLFIEYESVCTREPHLLAAGLSLRSAVEFLDAFAAFVEPVPIHFLWRPQLHDPADELVLETAVNAAADALLMRCFVSIAVAEKLAMMEAQTYFAERRERADLTAFDAMMARTGGEPPRDDDRILPAQKWLQARSVE